VTIALSLPALPKMQVPPGVAWAWGLLGVVYMRTMRVVFAHTNGASTMSELRSNGRSRRAAILSVDADLLARARTLGIDLSRTFEVRLAEVVTERELWLEANREALEAYNERIERDGEFSKGLRRRIVISKCQFMHPARYRTEVTRWDMCCETARSRQLWTAAY
jgi:antitoxin CcdA